MSGKEIDPRSQAFQKRWKRTPYVNPDAFSLPIHSGPPDPRQLKKGLEEMNEAIRRDKFEPGRIPVSDPPHDWSHGPVGGLEISEKNTNPGLGGPLPKRIDATGLAAKATELSLQTKKEMGLIPRRGLSEKASDLRVNK